MKSHERRAVERAVDTILEQTSYDYPKSAIPRLQRKAVNLAMLRAGRLYDHHTEAEAMQQAGRLIRDFYNKYLF